jgi:hypothetical protein
MATAQQGKRAVRDGGLLSTPFGASTISPIPAAADAVTKAQVA